MGSNDRKIRVSDIYNYSNKNRVKNIHRQFISRLRGQIMEDLTHPVDITALREVIFIQSGIIGNGENGMNLDTTLPTR